MDRLFVLFTRKRLIVWGVGLLVLGWALHAYTMSTGGLLDRDGRLKGGDYTYFYISGSLVANGRAEMLYDRDAHVEEGRRRIDPGLQLFTAQPNYGPQVALIFAPLAILPYGWSLAVFLVLSGLAYAASVWLLWRCCDALSEYGPVVAVLAAASPLFLTLVRYGQLSAFTLLFWTLAIAALVGGRPFAAGLAIGALAFKPQLGVVVGVAVLAARQWRVVAGAAVAVVGQLAVGWLVGGADVMRAYVEALRTLAVNPSLVQPYPSEVHSVRGLLQLLIPSSRLVTVGAVAAAIGSLWLGVRGWTSAASIPVRFGIVVLLTILASPHLLAYDLLLLTIPLLAFADWVIRRRDDPRRMGIAFLLVPLYFAPFSGNLARAIHLQLSVVVMIAIVWRMSSLIPARTNAPIA